jgi:hypothetical protein
MKLTNILEKENNALIFEQHMNNSRTILSESVEGMNAVQRAIVEGIYNDLKPLIEASLTADQVQQLFKGVEQNVSATGNNRTLIGQGKDIPGKVNNIVNKVGRWLQDTTPVKAADQKFEQLKTTIGTKFPELDKQLTGLGSWMKENPGKTAAVIGVLTAIASLAGGPVGGAIAGQVLKGSVELIKGEKLSTAVGKGLKAAAVGWLAGKSMEAVGKMVSGVVQYLDPLPISGFNQFYQENIGNGLPNIFRDAEIVGTKEQLAQFNKLWAGAARQWNSGNFEGARDAFSQAQSFASQVSAETYKAMGEDPGAKIKLLNDVFAGLSAAAQGAATGAAGYDKQGKPVQDPKKESYHVQSRALSEGQVYMIFDRVCSINNQMLSEGKIWEADDPAAPKMSTWEKIKTKASEFGKNLTTKVTASKLNSAWKAAKQPTDSEELGAFLVKQGVNAEVVGKTFVDMKLPKPKAAQAVEKKPAAGQSAAPGAAATPSGTPVAEKPAPAAGQSAAPGAAATPSASPTTPTAEKPAVSTSSTNSSTGADTTPQPNAAGAGPTKNTNTLYSQIRADIKQLDKRSKQQLMSYLEKGLRA